MSFGWRPPCRGGILFTMGLMESQTGQEAVNGHISCRPALGILSKRKGVADLQSRLSSLNWRLPCRALTQGFSRGTQPDTT